MTDQSPLLRENAHWALAGIAVFAAHAAAVAIVMSWTGSTEPPAPEPVVLVDLPPEAAPAPSETIIQQRVTPQPESQQPQPVTPKVEAPLVRAPLPPEPVVVATKTPPVSVRSAAAQPVSAPAVRPVVPQNGESASPSPVAGNDPKAKAAEADYFAMVSAHLNRKKRYPTEAKKAQQQGVVTVRFTVARDGSVSTISIKRSSGHDLLDEATLDLLRRVSPLPKMPSSMTRDSVTLSLPIDYSLRTN